MDKNKLAKLGTIVDFMDESGWETVVSDMSRLHHEVGRFLKDIQYDGYTASPFEKLYIELSVASVDIAEAKYNGYCELLKNADNPELLKPIAAKHKEALQTKEDERNQVVARIADAISSLQGLQERIMALGDIQKYLQ